MRRSPHEHVVGAHTRGGKPVGSYPRGKGQKFQRSSKVVGHSVPEEVKYTYKMFNKVNNAAERKLFGWCGMAAVALAYQIGGDVVFGYFKNDEMYGDEGEGHIWVEKDGMIYDPTADQFDGVTGPVVAMRDDKRYTPHTEESAFEVWYDSDVEQPLRWEDTLIRTEIMQTEEGEDILKEQSMSRSKIWKLIGGTK